MSRLNLEGKTAIVTGAAAGIGRSICTVFAEEGVNVVVADIDAEAGQVTADDLEELGGGRHSFVQTDVTSIASVTAMVRQVIQDYGQIDILVNNAGINMPRLLVDPNGREELTEALFDQIYVVNQKGAFLCAQAVARQMIAQSRGGVVINMASEAGLEGSEGQSAYSGTKGALYALTRCWAKELGKFNIRVVGAAPAVLEPTALRNPEYERALAYTRGITVEELNESYKKVSVPLGRVGQLEEVADLVCFLASDMASYITGTTVSISGGKSRG